MTRRAFIGGCAAGAVAAGLPGAATRHLVAVTIPLESVIFAYMEDGNRGSGFAHIDGGDGQLVRVGVRLALDRFGRLNAYNTGLIVG